MAQNGQDFRGAFDEAAQDFTALGEHLWDPIGAGVLAVAKPGLGERVLDACCGTGATALPTAEAVGESGLVDAVDLSEPMVDVLRRRSALPQLHAHSADVTAWPVGDYDLVQCALGIFFFPDMASGTEHLISRARPGGRVVLTVWRGHTMMAPGRHLGHAVAAVTGAEDAPPRLPNVVDQINQADPYAAWLTERGLSGVDVTEHELRLPMTPEVAWLVVLGSGFRRVLANLDAAAIAKVRERYLKSLQDDGLSEVDATTLIATGTR